MKTSRLLFIALMVLVQTVFPQNGSIKVKESTTKFLTHNPIAGIELLKNNSNLNPSMILSDVITTPSAVYGGLTSSGYCNKSSVDADVKMFILNNKEIFGLVNPYEELKLVSSSTDELGMTHLKYRQVYSNAEITSSMLVFHINSNGSIESMNGGYLPSPVSVQKAVLSANDAINLSNNFLNNYTPSEKTSEFVYYRKGIELIPAYRVKLPSKDFPMMELYIDAIKGTLLYKDDGIRYDGPAVGSGTSLTGTTRTLNTYLYSSKYYLADASLPMYVPPFDSLKGMILTYDAKNSLTGNGYDEAALVFDPDNNNNFNDNMGLRAAVDAHYHTLQVYNFYKSYFNRNSFNNNGGSLLNVVHYKQNYNNAFWNGVSLTYGDGDGIQFSNLAGALDVICHEMTHGVISSSANLEYRSQSGAMNESFADVFGVLLDSTDWLLGEDVYTPGISGDALRSMQDPHNGNGDNWQPAHMNEFQILPENEEGDRGGVHTNSGIPNKAFYNAASNIGRYKAGLIWYRTLTLYLYENAQFRDLRIAALFAARDFFGLNSTEYNAVKNAFDNVGVYTNTPSYYSLAYDDGYPDQSIYENLANWKIAVKFTAPSPVISIDSIGIYLNGDQNNGNGHFTLELFDANASGMPNNSLITPYSYTPTNKYGWQVFWVSGLTVSSDFFVSAKYDGTNWPLIGVDVPGNNRTYEYDPTNGWAQLTGANNYTVFMRADVSSTFTDVEIDTKIPDKFEISENYPNPFNPSTTIKYSLPEAKDVLIVVYDINGNKIAELANNFHNPGTYTITWNGKSENGTSVSSGIYYCNIKVGTYLTVRKMVLMK